MVAINPVWATAHQIRVIHFRIYWMISYIHQLHHFAQNKQQPCYSIYFNEKTSLSQDISISEEPYHLYYARWISNTFIYLFQKEKPISIDGLWGRGWGVVGSRCPAIHLLVLELTTMPTFTHRRLPKYNNAFTFKLKSWMQLSWCLLISISVLKRSLGAVRIAQSGRNASSNSSVSLILAKSNECNVRNQTQNISSQSPGRTQLSI